MRDRRWLRVVGAGLVLLATLVSGFLGYRRAQEVFRQMQLAEAGRWLEGRVIVLDPGHGGRDPGTVANGLKEKELTLSIALILKEMLEEKGATVVLTRESDTELDQLVRKDLLRRVEVAAEHNADVLLSIHVNKGVCNCRGAQTFYQRGKNSGKELAEVIQAQLRRFTPTTREALPGNFLVLRMTEAPGALVEVGFLNHVEEAGRLQQPDYQRTLAEAVMLGLAEFFQRQVPPARSEGELGE